MSSKKQLYSSLYVNEQRRNYSLYVMQSRAIPAVSDGLKASARRVLWTARDGHRIKTATLAGATAPIHPHAPPVDAINSLAAPYDNNIPLLVGQGAFGTMLNPKSYGAERYTHVKLSKFTKEVVFADIDIIPMMLNYDDTLEEPVHFLPLVPIVLLNPTQGLAVGFKTNILPRDLTDLIIAQIAYLNGTKKVSNPTPKFLPTQSTAISVEGTNKGVAYTFVGNFVREGIKNVRVNNLPFGMLHKNFVEHLNTLIEADVINDYEDNSSKVIDILVEFPKGRLSEMTDEDIIEKLKLSQRHVEILNVLDFTGEVIWPATPDELIKKFTEWRLGWYTTRYERLLKLVDEELQRYYDIRTAIKNDVGSVAKKLGTRGDLKDFLQKIKIMNLDYITDLPVYKFTKDEAQKNEDRIKEAEERQKTYKEMLKSENKRRQLYIDELHSVLKKYSKGYYDEGDSDDD